MDIAETQLRPKLSHAELFQRPESDKEFLRKLIIHTKKVEENPNVAYSASELCFCHEGFLMRQKFLRSYPFSGEETVPETTNKDSKNVHQKTKTKWQGDKGLGSFLRVFKNFLKLGCAGKANAVHPHTH